MKMTVGRGRGREEWQQRKFQLFIIANLFFIEFQKRHQVTEVVIFVSFNFPIHQGQKRETNQIFRLISKEKNIMWPF